MVGNMRAVLCFLVFILGGCANMVSYQMTKPIAGAKMHSELVSDMELFYYVLGDKNKPTLIFLHGILAFTEIYKSFLKSLSDHFYIVGVDLPGHGRSSLPQNNYDIYNMGEDVIKLTKKLNLNPFYLVGHSMGGLITLSICEKYPENVIKAVSITSLYNVTGINFKNNRYDFLTQEGFRKNSENHTNFLLKVFNLAYDRINEGSKFNRTKNYLYNYKSNLYPQISPKKLEFIDIPILVVVAEKDQLIKPEHTRIMSELLPKGTLVSFPNANHGNIIRSKRNIKRLTKNITYFFDI